MNFSAYEQAIFDHIERGKHNAVVDAVAGSGKRGICQGAALLPHGPEFDSGE